MKPIFLLLLVTALPLGAGPYPGAAGTAGSDAISKDDASIVQWVSGHLNYEVGSNVSASWRTPAKAHGPATTDPFDIVCLGDDGGITLHFPHPVRDGPGADFAVFENSFSDTFLELAFVEVSSDGVNFIRFPSASLTASLVGGFGSVDPTNLSGLAGKYRGGFGTPFDLASLPASPLLDKSHVPFIRLIDIKGNGSAKDSENRPIYDPHPTSGSAGFDLDAIGVIHLNIGELRFVRWQPLASTVEFEWQSNPTANYRLETSTTLGGWATVATVAARADRGTSLLTVPRSADLRRFWRIVRVGD
jgi:hypothetical protein